MAFSHLRQDQAGFTLVELLVAMFVAATGIIATVAVLDSSRQLVSVSERKEAMTHVAEQGIECVRALGYDQIAHTSVPSTSTDPNDPRYYVTGGTSPTYRWNQEPSAPSPNTEPLVGSGGGLAACPTSWGDARLGGSVYPFITWVEDPALPGKSCPGCAGERDYKRITVAVTVAGTLPPKRPILISSFVHDPDGS